MTFITPPSGKGLAATVADLPLLSFQPGDDFDGTVDVAEVRKGTAMPMGDDAMGQATGAAFVFSRRLVDATEYPASGAWDQAAKLGAALTRWGPFFASPLFAADATRREVEAINSEHSKNLKSDAFRVYQLEKSLFPAAHPFSKFGTGNRTTLRPPDGTGEPPRLGTWFRRA